LPMCAATAKSSRMIPTVSATPTCPYKRIRDV
jgi:hypothetical protein